MYVTTRDWSRSDTPSRARRAHRHVSVSSRFGMREPGAAALARAPARPGASIYRAVDGTWMLECAGSPIILGEMQTFELEGHTWKLTREPVAIPRERHLPASMPATAGGIERSALALTFAVSRDEEHVELKMEVGGRTIDLGARAHNYLLLTLARLRLADRAAGFSEEASGWVEKSLLERDPSMSASALNLSIFRIRRQFAAVGVVGAAAVIERRPGARQIRIGIARLSSYFL